MSSIMDLRNKRAALWQETKSFLETHRNENGMVDAASVAQYDRMTADVKALGDEIKRLEDQMELDAQLAAPTSTPVQTKPMARKEKVKVTATEEYNTAFWDAMRSEMHTIEIRNALSIGKDDEGGFTVPDEFVRL